MSMLHDNHGNRKYLTAGERARFIEAARAQPTLSGTFCMTLAYTGARISEVLALKAGNIDIEGGVIVIESLKKRSRGVFRQVPVPDVLISELLARHQLVCAQPEQRLWSTSRTTVWKDVKLVMREVGVPAFCATPKAFGVGGIVSANVPLNLMQRWLGHSRIETTAIYANAVGPEERAIASRMWT